MHNKIKTILLVSTLITFSPLESFSQEVSETSTTQVYDQSFFTRFPNAISVLDIIRRIPAGQSILNAGNTSASRGFSNNDDRILINGRRQSGKSNNSEDTLGRITMDQVERIEIIQGASPDIKIRAGQSIINIVLKENIEKGSGSWKLLGGENDGKHGFSGFLSYGDKIGNLEYFLSADIVNRENPAHYKETFSDGSNTPFEYRQRELLTDTKDRTFAGNMVYNLNSGQQIRLNGQYKTNDVESLNEAMVYSFDNVGSQVFKGDSTRNFENDRPSWEIGGDTEFKLGQNWRLKFIGLRSVRDGLSETREDRLLEGTSPVDDYVFISDTKAGESIGRLSLTYQKSEPHKIEIASETAVNTLDSKLQFFLNQNGQLVEQSVSAGETQIKETRNESFLTHTWKPTSKLTIESQLISEFSRISQTGVGINVSRDFYFFKPSFDINYSLSSRDQLVFTVRKVVNQLNFGNFASSNSDDNQVVGGNTRLEPEKFWDFEVSLEHKFDNDAGRVRVATSYREFQDKIDRIETSPGVSGVGNVGRGTRLYFGVSGSFRAIWLGLPDLIIEPKIDLHKTRVVDQFTGKSRRFNPWSSHYIDVRVRHDINKWGLTYGAQLHEYSHWTFHDIDETIPYPARITISGFIEKKIFGDMTLKFEGQNLTNADNGRERFFYADGIVGGIVTTHEKRFMKSGPVFYLSLRGSF